MANLAIELADLNVNARVLLEKHDNTFKELDKKSIEIIKQIDLESQKAKELILKTVADTDVKALGDEYKKLFDSKLKAIDAESAKMKAEVESAIKQAKSEIKAFDYVETAKPAIKTNPLKKNATWLDLTTGTIWVCSDNTKDKNKWVSEKGSIGSISFNKVDIFNDGSCIFYAPFNNTTNELTGSYISKLSGSLKKTDAGLLNDSVNNTNAINFKDLSLPDEFSFSAFIQETDDTNTSVVTAIEFRNANCGVYGGNMTGTDGKRSISFAGSDSRYQSNDGNVVEVTYGERYHIVYIAKRFITQNDNGDDVENFNITGYLNGEKVVDIDETAKLFADTTQRVLLFQEGDRTDDDGWDKGWDKTQCFVGYIKDFRIFNRVITDDEAKILAQED